ncbi:hypothetical protein QJS04_geneDACA014472 [Acorus gramineus]|uniref:Uncharacterized protein n=1 Tax=Acorus gramineus TaxID=55184 RepID=A0AAV9BLM9_ACOGR|nr:hypothetical protein QJS04_geneDACA014472 [Acorus gramineus]
MDLKPGSTVATTTLRRVQGLLNLSPTLEFAEDSPDLLVASVAVKINHPFHHFDVIKLDGFHIFDMVKQDRERNPQLLMTLTGVEAMEDLIV